MNSLNDQSLIGIISCSGAGRDNHDRCLVRHVKFNNRTIFELWKGNFGVGQNLPVEMDKVIETGNNLSLSANHCVNPLSDIGISFEVVGICHIKAATIGDFLVNDGNLPMQTNVCTTKQSAEKRNRQGTFKMNAFVAEHACPITG